jgi:hypothetical protein
MTKLRPDIDLCHIDKTGASKGRPLADLTPPVGVGGRLDDFQTFAVTAILLVLGVAGSACFRGIITHCWRPVAVVGRPPTVADKKSKAQQTALRRQVQRVDRRIEFQSGQLLGVKIAGTQY